MTLTRTGIITHLSAIEHRGNFKKRQFAIRQEDGIHLGLQLINNKVYTYDDLTIGDTITAEFTIVGKPWGGKVFNNLIVSHLEIIDDSGTQKEKRQRAAIKKYRQEK